MANDFSQDHSCLALYLFEPGELTTDSKGANTLSSQNSPSCDEADYQEGSGSVILQKSNSQCFYINDANLPSGWPFKSGDTGKKFTTTFWFKPASSSAWQYIMGKENYAGGHHCFTICSNNLGLYVGYCGSSFNNYSGGFTFVIGRWYHVSIKIDGVNGTITFRIWDDTNQTISTKSYTGLGAINLISDPFCIGSDSQSPFAEFLDGKLDEVTIFNRLLSDAECDAIRTGSFPVPPSLVVYQTLAQVEYSIPPKLKSFQVVAQIEYAEATAPNNSFIKTTCEDIPEVPDKATCLVVVGSPAAVVPATLRIRARNSNLARTNPASDVCRTTSPGPKPHAGLFLIF